MKNKLNANLTRFTGVADVYDRFRPSVPIAVTNILSHLAQVKRPKLVVDIGCGTGLSTRIWAGNAQKVIGVEPNPDMRRQAQESTKALKIKGIAFQEGTSTDIGLPDACADVVTACQSLHWMEPKATFAEIARILRTSGVFAACDADFPPTTNWEIESASQAFRNKTKAIEKKLGIPKGLKKWPKAKHLSRMEASGQFRFTKELFFHQIERGNAARLVGLAMSQSTVAALLNHGLTEEEIGLSELREAAQRFLGRRPMPWHFSYRIRVGVK
jgi:ubiquinone/menaquinone biosynthesis C-methylase UbiE